MIVDRLRHAAPLLVLALLAGCASVDPYAASPMAEHLQRTDSVGDCARLFRTADAKIDAAGVRDASAPRVAGFPYLRVDRFTAALAPEAQRSRAFGPWAELMAQLDQQARVAELANLGSDALPPSPAFDGCRTTLAVADDRQLAPLAAAAVVPDDYSDWERALGLYPLTRVAFAAGIAGWQQRTLATFGTPLNDLPRAGAPVAYAPPARPQLTLRLPASATFALPNFSTTEWAEAIARHAPRIVVDTASDDDRIGALAWRADGDGLRVAADTAQPVVYVRVAFTRFNGQVLPQLVYTFWFPARPAEGSFDVLAGALDGLIWRVTLDRQGAPLVYDSIHPCGCYHLFFPTERVRARPQPATPDEGLFAPQTVTAPRAGERIELHLASRTHYLQRVRVVPPVEDGAAVAYELIDENALRTLPLPAGGSRSAYGPDGLIAGTERAERYFFWPMGIASAGQMRQWGRHATAFVGRRHFDDADLLDRYFEPAPP
ncbi:MAG: hypothetical protein LW847_07820 [Burkholderiales bacterium]|nr:hypothetical protein [Burkholderiales bacterium]